MQATQIKAQDLQLQEGKRYRRRDGQITGPLNKIPRVSSSGFFYHDPETGCLYWETGAYQHFVESKEDLVYELDIITINEQGKELPDASMMIAAPRQFQEMEQVIRMQAEKIKKLQAAIDRKNKVFSEVMDMVRYELAKEIE